MAIIWNKKTPNGVYQIRKAGNSVRFYKDGVFHTQYNPEHLFSGNVWDLLSLPALYLRPESIKRVLLLGVGGGAVIHHLQAVCSPPHISGIELDALSVKLMYRFFHVRKEQVSIHIASARDWLEQYQGEAFDLIIDDLFTEQQGEPCRAFAFDHAWQQTLLRNLSSHGLLVVNFDSRAAFNSSALRHDAKKRFSKAVQFSHPRYSNRIVACYRGNVSEKDFAENLAALPARDRRIRLARLHFQRRKLF